MNDEMQERTTAILRQLKGLSVQEALDLLKQCGDCIMREVTVDFSKSKSYLKAHAGDKNT